jgi:lipopolysaccharide export system permease protein
MQLKIDSFLKSSNVNTYTKSLIELVPDSQKTRVTDLARSTIRNQQSLVSITETTVRFSEENKRKFEVYLHLKFTLSFACILLFLIGAPLGAIIRKGGLGLPIVVAVSFFVVYHITSITGEKLSTSGALPPAVGMWMSTAMLLPIAVFIINAARNDSALFTKDKYMRIVKFFAALFNKKKTAANN